MPCRSIAMPILFPKVCAHPGSVQQVRLEWVNFLLLGIKRSSHFTGMLLRFFAHFYDMEIIEEEAFLSWKEDVTQEYPGKGKALFQVLSLLNSSLCSTHANLLPQNQGTAPNGYNGVCR